MATISEALRRLYHDLILRRSTVRVVSSVQNVELTEAPIFLVGVYRSGTTLLRYVMDSHSSICVPPECDFLGPLSSLVNGDPYAERLKDMGYDHEHVRSKVRELALYFYGNYAASRNKKRWADKSPSYVDYLEGIADIFPEAQFVMIYRHGFDQVESFTRRGTFMRDAFKPDVRSDEDIRIGATRYWVNQVQKMQAFEQQHPQRCFRIGYESLCEQPETRLKELFAFLGEPWEPQVLEYYKFDHDKGAEDGRVAATRGFDISTENYVDWPAKLTSACTAIAGTSLNDLGYKIVTS